MQHMDAIRTELECRLAYGRDTLARRFSFVPSLRWYAAGLRTTRGTRTLVKVGGSLRRIGGGNWYAVALGSSNFWCCNN
jgi:hypothetical protein